MDRDPCVYILASARNGTLYIGVTSDLNGRMQEHVQGIFEGFTKKYGVKQLVYYEMHIDMEAAIAREKRIKKWNRIWKIGLIERSNPEWLNLYDEQTDEVLPHPADAGRFDREE